MSYLRLFIELRKEDTNAPCGQVRVELQDQPGRVDCKVRCGLMGLTPGQTYEMVLVCEQSGRYKEYPVGPFMVNPRGQAGPMFRGSFESETGQISVTDFKAVVARSAEGSRLVGFRFEPMLIPWQYEEAVAEPESDAEPEATAELESEINLEPETTAEQESRIETEAVERPEFLLGSEPESEAEVLPESSSPEEMPLLQKQVEKQEPAEIPPAAVWEPAAEEIFAERASKLLASEAFTPTAIYVLRDLSQVDLVCGDAGRRAFQRYRHLILAQQGQVNYLGIPSRFRPTQRMELADEGYTLFYTPHGDEPGFGEFGYWMKRL